MNKRKRMKKALSFLLSALLVFSLLPVSLLAEEETEEIVAKTAVESASRQRNLRQRILFMKNLKEGKRKCLPANLPQRIMRKRRCLWKNPHLRRNQK